MNRFKYSCADHHECSPEKRNCEQYRARPIIHNPETKTVVRIEHADGETHEFVLKSHCDREHISYGLYDSDYDYVTLAFEHWDVSTEPCLGTRFLPGF